MHACAMKEVHAQVVGNHLFVLYSILCLPGIFQRCGQHDLVVVLSCGEGLVQYVDIVAGHRSGWSSSIS